MDNEPTPSDLIAARVRGLREGRGMTVAELAARCAAAGMPRLTAQVLYKLEGQREKRAARPVSVDELLVLAYVLDVAPVHLMAGLDDDDAGLPVTPGIAMTASDLRRWIRGFKAFPGTDIRHWRANRPDSELFGLWVFIDNTDDLDARIAATEQRLAELKHYRQNRDEGIRFRQSGEGNA